MEISGGPELAAALVEMGEKITRGSADAVNEFGLILTTNIKKGYHAHQSSGRTYKRTSKGGSVVTHVASAAGFAPNSDTGDLANSVTFRQTGPATAEVFTRLDYGFVLEFGTRDGTIATRPLWRPERDKLEPKFVGKLLTIIEGSTE